MDQILIGKGDQQVHLLPKYGNRHGLIAGATGTGKTVSLLVLAEGFSRLGVPVFIFHEGGEPIARRAFQQIARLSGGAYCSFDTGSAKQLRDLLSAVAVYAAGGRPALEDFGKRRGGAVLQITNQMR